MNGCHASAHVAQQGPTVVAFYTKMSLRICSCGILSESARFVLTAGQKSENVDKNNGYPEDLWEVFPLKINAVNNQVGCIVQLIFLVAETNLSLHHFFKQICHEAS